MMNTLKPPDLSELMSQIIRDCGEDERLVFVEYDPATRAFYNHIGLPVNVQKVQEMLDNARSDCESCGKFLEKLCDTTGMPEGLKSIFPATLAQTAKSLLHYHFDVLSVFDAIDIEKLGIHERFLICIARLNNEKDKDWLKSIDAYDLYELFRWLIQRVPQSEDVGSSSKLKCRGWTKVDNSMNEIGKFPDLAGLEFIFGMRTQGGNYHARLNVHLETGECVGQMIVFSDQQYPDNLPLLRDRAVEAVSLVRRTLPEVRQARYVDRILSGGEGGDLEHILIRFLPTLIPLEKFFVRIINQAEDGETPGCWRDFFSGEAKVALHAPTSPETSDRTFRHFKQNLENPQAAQPDDYIKTVLASIESSWKDGFIDWENGEGDQGVVIAFSTLTSGRRKDGVAILAVTDKKYFPRRLFALSKDQAFDNQQSHKWYYRDSEQSKKDCYLPRPLFYRTQCFSVDDAWKRFLRTQLMTTLAVVLEPGRPLQDHLVHTKKDGKTYREQYGTAIYGQSYLDIETPNDIGGESEDFRAISEIIRDTQEKLTDTLYEPRGYRAIAKVIFDQFFCQIWRYFGIKGDPAQTKDGPASDSRTPLGRLVREALDFEDTLRLEGGYREHFIHSYHVFLIGLVLIKKLPGLFEKVRLTENHLQTWFLTAMYHDIAYPIQKMESIASKYLQRLDPGALGWPCVGDRLSVELRIGYGSLMGSDLFGTRLRYLTNTFVQELFDSQNSRHKKLEEWLGTLHVELDMDTYGSGLKESFFQHCLRMALNDGEHGILSALLLQNAARRSQDWAGLKDACAVASVAILSHHSLEDADMQPKNDDETRSKWWLSDRWCILGGGKEHLQKLKHAGKTEIAEAIGFAPTLFSYDLGSSNPYRFFASMLILCDTFSQWGRSKDVTGEDRIYLRKPKGKPGLTVALCYPDRDKDSVKKIQEKYYEPQLNAITFSSEHWLLGLSYGCEGGEGLDGLPEKCDECTKQKMTYPNKFDGTVKPTIDEVMSTCKRRLERRLKNEKKEEDNVSVS